MTTTVRPASAEPVSPEGRRRPSDPVRKTALVAGALYLITFASSIPAAFVFIDPVLANADFMTRSGADTPLLWGSLLNLINALACIGTAVVLFPVIKRQHEATALGFVTTRIFEAAVIVIGIVSLLAVVTLRQDLAGAAGTDVASLATAGNTLAAIHQWTMLLGPGVMAAINALLLGSLMYRSRLVPRVIPLMGLVGAPLLLTAVLASFFGFTDQFSAISAIAVAPIFLWELSLGFYMAIKGFKPSPITNTSGTPSPVPVHAPVPVA